VDAYQRGIRSCRNLDNQCGHWSLAPGLPQAAHRRSASSALRSSSALSSMSSIARTTSAAADTGSSGKPSGSISREQTPRHLGSFRLPPRLASPSSEGSDGGGWVSPLRLRKYSCPAAGLLRRWNGPATGLRRSIGGFGGSIRNLGEEPQKCNNSTLVRQHDGLAACWEARAGTAALFDPLGSAAPGARTGLRSARPAHLYELSPAGTSGAQPRVTSAETTSSGESAAPADSQQRVASPGAGRAFKRRLLRLLRNSRSSQRLGAIEVRPGTPEPGTPKVEDVPYWRIDPSAASSSPSLQPTQHEDAVAEITELFSD